VGHETGYTTASSATNENANRSIRRRKRPLLQGSKALTNELGLAVETDGERFLQDRLALLGRELANVERLAAVGELPDAAVAKSGRLKITPLDSAVPDEAQAQTQQALGLLPLYRALRHTAPQNTNNA
jgi:hypothetical protein